MTRQVHVYSRMARALYTVTWVIGLLATLGGMFDPTAGPDSTHIFPGAAFVAAEVILIFRSQRIGLVIDQNHVTSRGLVRTRKIPRSSVTAVKTTGYSGTITYGSTSGYFMMLRLKLDDRTVDLPHLIGTAKAVRVLADHAHAALGLPSRSPST